MLQIKVCIGSSCHLKGSYDVIRALQTTIARHGLQGQIELLAGFCLGQCMHGVVVQVGEQKIIGVFPEQVEELFRKHVLPEVDSPGSPTH
ncbi:MAG TPA: (2Fe-2S) ferredoxin domain-containing protein [Firmicutes bacterium]|jgi:NADH:ubiquinone oxidoreductase subunit E|nr:(2Fe-2S) ferredoxin domain-containing protein [Bacillota bacterium]